MGCPVPEKKYTTSKGGRGGRGGGGGGGGGRGGRILVLLSHRQPKSAGAEAIFKAPII